MLNQSSINSTSGITKDLVTTHLSICTVAECIFLLIAMFVFSSMIAYGNATRKWSFTNSTGGFLNNKTIYIACFLATFLVIPRFLWTIVIIEVPRWKCSDTLCETLMDITGLTYVLAAGPTYMFLWLRQRALYANPSIRKLTGNWANGFSWALVVFLSVSSLVMVIVIQTPKSYFALAQGCAFRPAVGYETNFYILAPF